MSEPLAGRTAIVTGASRGIGLAAAAALHDAGANVVLTARTEEAARAAADSVGPRALGIGAHATDEDLARACVERTMEAFGSVDVLVNNAGTNPAYGPVLAQDHGRFAKTLDVNLWAPILWSRLVVDAWMGEHGGSIVNTASIGGLSVGPDLGIYHVSKAALIHLTKQLAIELAPSIRVNAVAPGVVRTKLAEALWKEHEGAVVERTPLARIGEPDDVGAAVLFLASSASSWITGETLVIDGGQMIGSGAAADALAARVEG
ncbi:MULTISPECIES: SDR family oxidoreductase [unclassified Aeromicrobium]|uniref:SDR family oxidoreductase n=1 Tax=unclassified Aeromicrobium TaxID=2633570 RepID=UPI0006FB7F9B|nr:MULTISPECIES: SDR family oxidoreductase [unclassified Aeromicrobium]KQP78492.1 3-ketoacyl-ACP reductase [Aeromicrobium sp. Leaf289]MCR4513791.1 SDR family oxidoreductase [Aeromicrobium sp. 50.2.37]RYY51696.1 MAG: SDR family oxidoreductase [Actinomycetales bacterium]